MVAIQIEKTPERWPEILKQLESGHPVRLLRKRTVVATLWPRRKLSRLKKSAPKSAQAEQRRIGAAGRKLAARVLEPEDFSAWKR